MHTFQRLARHAMATAAIGFVALLAGCGGAGESLNPPPSPPLGSIIYTASLIGAQENPPSLTAATGVATLAVNVATGELSGSITTTGMTGNAAHFHLGNAGSNGPVVLPLSESSAGSGIWVVASGTILSTDLRAALASGSLYANVHSVSFPGGQIRGQMAVTTRTASMTGTQENPPVTTPASGNAILAVEPNTRALTARMTLSGMSATAAHIHEAAIGINGPVIVPMTETAAGSGIWTAAAGATLTPTQYQSFLAGNLYFNAHSTAFPGGEVRGQIGTDITDVRLAADQEVPPVASAETATARIIVDPITLLASGSITTSVPAVAAHIHTGVFGANGPVTFPFTRVGTSNVWTMAPTTMTTAQYRSYLFGDMYVNVHSAAFPGGELRGQIGKVIRTGNLSAAQEVPTNASTATGRGRAEFDPISGAFRVNMTTSGITATVAHIHTGAIGANGGVTVGFVQTSPGVWSAAANARLTQAQATAFAADGMYFNVHSVAFPGGEIRAQANGRD